jgi:isopentenyl-diphosphate delta-isomerase
MKNKLFTYGRKKFSSLETENLLKNFHPSQSKTMHESLIIVDQNDKPIDSISKIDAHLKSKRNPFPHRAFSVFLFNQENKLLLQKRSSVKVTFPNLWSNTCCSHPLAIEEEKEEKLNLGIKKAAVRRMEFEFGVDTQVQDYYPVERILYRADSDEHFEEYELDYILIAKIDYQESFLKRVMNSEEIADFKYISKIQLIDEIKSNTLAITPWFRLIVENRLESIWNYAENLEENFKDQNIPNETHKIKIINYL